MTKWPPAPSQATAPLNQLNAPKALTPVANAHVTVMAVNALPVANARSKASVKNARHGTFSPHRKKSPLKNPAVLTLPRRQKQRQPHRLSPLHLWWP